MFEAPLEAGKRGRLGRQVSAARQGTFDLQAAVHQGWRADDHQCAADAMQYLHHACGVGGGDRLAQAVQVALHGLHEQRLHPVRNLQWRIIIIARIGGGRALRQHLDACVALADPGQQALQGFQRDRLDQYALHA